MLVFPRHPHVHSTSLACSDEIHSSERLNRTLFTEVDLQVPQKCFKWGLKLPNYSLSNKSKTSSHSLLLRTGSETLWWERGKNKEPLLSIWIIKWETRLAHYGYSHKQACISSGLHVVSLYFFFLFSSKSRKHTKGFHFKAVERMPCAFWLCLAFVQWTIKERIFFLFLSLLFLNVKLFVL